MNLRTVTIWTTAVMMLATIVAPCIFCVFHPPRTSQHIVTLAFLWFTSIFPLVVSLVLAITLRYHISSIILLVSTIAYGIWYASALPTLFFEYLGVVILLYLGILSLPVMIPAWIAALLLNRYYVTKTPNPG